MKTCEHLIYKKSGGVEPCGRTAKYEYLGKPVCSRHSPEAQEEAKVRKAARFTAKMQRMVDLLEARREQA